MRILNITEKQRETIVNQLAEAPAKFVFNAMNILLGLPEAEEPVQEEK